VLAQTCVTILKLLVKLINRELDEDNPDEVVSRPPIYLAELGDIFVPDKDNCLLPSSQIYYDDAPWISATLPPNVNKYLHTSFTVEEGKMLGAKSLRAQLFSGDEIMCPEAAAVTKMLGTDGIEDMLSDLLAFTDYVGGSGMHVVYDSRTFNSESLMHPGLREAQGPALTAFLEGPVLDGEHIMQYLSNPVMLAALTEEKTQNHEQRIYPKCGKRLAACFAVTDCLQIMTGKDFYLFDPCGKYLLRMDSASEALKTSDPIVSKGVVVSKSRSQSATASLTGLRRSDNANASIVSIEGTPMKPNVPPADQPRAQKCLVTTGQAGRVKSSSTAESGSAEKDILHRFPDQFAGFLQLPFKVEDSLLVDGFVRGVVIRMPLRTQRSALSVYIPSLEEVKFGLREFRTLLRCSLVSGSSLSTGSVSHFDEVADRVLTDFEVCEKLFFGQI
jgi:hypothetical protein